MARVEIVLGRMDALIVVDMQKDFIEGSLPVPGARDIIPNINRYIKVFAEKGCTVVFTRDWHPENHASFKENGGLWPRHCVAGTEGAMIHKDITLPKEGFFVINKGTSPDFDAYSGFQDTKLDALLRERGIKRIFLCGVATEYCVKATAEGGLNLGYQVFLLLDAIKGVGEEASRKALEDLYLRGAVGIEL